MKRGIFIALGLFFLIPIVVAIPARAAQFSFSNNLRLGESGSEAAMLQEYLATAGYFNVSPTGYFGPITFKAVKAWQLANNISPTGFFGPISRGFILLIGKADLNTTTTIASNLVITATATSSAINTHSGNSGGVTMEPGTAANNDNDNSSTPSGPSVVITPATTTMLSHATTTFSATLSNDSGDAISWSASLGTIDPVSGAFTAPTIYATTTVMIYAQSQTISAVSSTAVVTVLPRPIAISISPTSTTVLSGATTTFSVTVLNATNTTVTWTAVKGTIDASSGIYTALTLGTSTLSATDTITVTSVANNTKIATASVTVSSGLIDWWQFNEQSGTVAFDTINSAHDGGWQGTPSGDLADYYTTGPVVSSSAGYFDGYDNYIDPDVTMSYTATSSFTWSAWMDLDDSISDNVVILGDRGNASQWIKLTPTGFEYDNGTLISNTIPTDTWELVTVIKNGSSFYYYQDGSLVGSASSSAELDNIPFYMGTDPNNNSDGYMIGGMSDVRIYDTALSESQIQDIYNAGAPIGISISPNAIFAANPSITQQFTATLTNTTNTAVTWGASLGSIDSNGLYHGPGPGPATATITVTSVADPRQSASMTIYFIVGGGDGGGA